MKSDGHLGASDAESRWIGVRRHQALLVVGGLTILSDALLRRGASRGEFLLGTALVLLASPWNDGATLFQWFLVVGRFATRSRWFSVGVAVTSAGLVVRTNVESTIAGFRLVHRGRRDLSGDDLRGANAFAQFIDATAVAGVTTHVSLHVLRSPRWTETLLCTASGMTAPSGFERDDALVAAALDLNVGGEQSYLERWGYVRRRHDVTAVIRIKDFSAAREGAWLERLQQIAAQQNLSLHLEVIDSARALRLAERASHRSRSDGALTSAAGFRRTARSERFLARLGAREAQVSSGHALLRIGVYVSVRAFSTSQLRHAVNDVWRAAHDAGLRCERGYGQQRDWFLAQLPGASW